MSGPIVTDHALVRFLERAAGLDVDGLRDTISSSLARSHQAARSLGSENHIVKADGLLYVVRGERLVSVLEDRGERDTAFQLNHPSMRGE